MKYLLSPKHLKTLTNFKMDEAILAFDYDGTLAKIVRNPHRAKILAKTETLLKRLNDRSPIAIISGRSVKDLKSLLGFSPQYLIGNHGIEGSIPDRTSLQAVKKTCKLWHSQLLQLLPFSDSITSSQGHLRKINDLLIENKTYSLSIHYRNVSDQKTVQMVIETALIQLSPSPRIIPGKHVYNITPADSPNKGNALLELMQQIGAKTAFYAGDDDTDEDVFKLKKPEILTVRVGKKSTSQATYFLKEQTEMDLVLKQLLEASSKKKTDYFT